MKFYQDINSLNVLLDKKKGCFANITKPQQI